MTPAQIRHLLPVFLLLSATGKAESTPDSSLTITANTPVALISPRQASRKFIRLPSLEYAFEIRARCLKNRKPTSLLLSVADTRKILDAEDMSSGPSVEATLRIPAAQIGPIAVEDFCHVADENAAGDNSVTEELTISAALSAHASLRCESESDQSVIYVSQPLDVNLICERPDQRQGKEALVDLD
jgi:hypothetical protein